MSTVWSVVRRVLAGGAVVALAVAFAGQLGGPDEPARPPTVAAGANLVAPEVLVHRTATCGCCGGYEGILEEAGYSVRSRVHADLALIRADLGVPDGESSCHTMEIGGYVVEGHVPLEAIDDLLNQQPAIDGIALAGMPAGSPGMAGQQEAPFRVTALQGGIATGVFGEY